MSTKASPTSYGRGREFEAYPARGPAHSMRDAIELRIAALWLLAYEMIMTADEPPSGAKKAETRHYRARADSMYARLSARPDPVLSSQAAIALFNLPSRPKNL